MSEYASINIEQLTLCTFRNYLRNEIVSLFFCKDDLIVEENCLADEQEEDSGTYTRYMYKSTVKRAKERMDALGYGMLYIEKRFTESPFRAVDYEPFLDHLRVNDDEYDEKAKERIQKHVTFVKWQNAMKKIVQYELQNGAITWYKDVDSKEKTITTECDKVIYYALREEYTESFYAIQTDFIPEAYVYRFILEYCPDNDEIVLDFSALDGWSEDSITKALSATENVEKTIVLVEGTSDKAILEFSLKKLFPHLSDLVYFMDFDDEHGGKREGGTPSVVKNLKTFYFSKIKSNFIAIFDNDAEGYESKCLLLNQVRPWPENFRILLYPELDLFRKYPTIAPNGSIVDDNINKKAASIELYLPDSIIQNEGAYSPVEWESRKKFKNEDGSDESLYQGVISRKNEIKQQFFDMKNRIERGEIAFNSAEWERMKSLLETIVFAFNKE